MAACSLIKRWIGRLGLIVIVCAPLAVGAASEAPITIADALKLSVEDPRSFLSQSEAWLAGDYGHTDPVWRRELLLRRGRAAWLMSDYVQARAAARQLDELAKTSQMPVAHAYALLLKADESADVGHFEAAIDLVNEAAGIMRATKDPYWLAIANAELCDVYWGSSQEDQAMARCRKAEKYLLTAADDWHLARVENVMAALLEASGELTQALETYAAARARLLRLGMPSMVAMVDDNVSSLYLANGDAAQALAVSQRSLAVELAAGKASFAVVSRSNIAQALSKLGRHKEALASIAAAIAEAKQHKLASRMEMLYLVQMEVAETANNLRLALEAARASMAAKDELSDERTERVITELEARYQDAEQRYDIERLSREQQIRELELSRAREQNSRQQAQLARQDLRLWLVTVTTTAFFLISVLMFALWRASRRHAERMRVLADTDGLTGVLNRRAFVDRMQACFDELPKPEGGACLCIVDADHFKRINDTRGHQVGDQALKRIARILSAELLPGQAAGRMGGEEFALLLPALSADQGLARAEQVRQAVASDHQQADGIGFPMSVSIGIAVLDPARTSDCEAWLVAADQALYRAKSLGRNRCELAPLEPPSPSAATG